MHGHHRIPPAHAALDDVIAHSLAQLAVEFAIDEGVEVAPVAQVVEVHHVGGNPG